MINKRLIGIVPESMKFIIGNVAYQWCSLAANIALMTALANLLAGLADGSADKSLFGITLIGAAAAVAMKYTCAIQSSRLSFLSSKKVRKTIRGLIYEKLLRLGSDYKERTKTSEIVQLAVEGVEQLETYFGAYLPQFFYAMAAPLTLFAVTAFINLPSAIILFVCVPLIPIAIAAIQAWAKKLLSKYWGQYTALGDVFLENLQGLTTLKIYQADDFKNAEMNEEAEKFRKITMKVLVMQLNSITIMDLVAYGGAALGIILATTQYAAGNVSLAGCLLILLLSADFFIPMRQLGSFFHIAMNGMAASGKIFALIDLDEPAKGTIREIPEDSGIVVSDLNFSYETDREILSDVAMRFPSGSFSAIVGESGCGKSTVAAILMGRKKNYTGTVTIGGEDLKRIDEAELNRRITYVSHNAYLFKGTVRDNLRMGRPDATDDECWGALAEVHLADFLKSENGLDTALTEKASNFSGGQCQRLALARALLHDSPIYIFDEATSNIDVDSESAILEKIYALAKTKTVILISHRLAAVVPADQIYVMDRGSVAESGTHPQLLSHHGLYQKLWITQQELEQLGAQEAGRRETH